MKISSCLYPQIVRNKYTGEYVAVPCGKCSACIQKRNTSWSFKLQQERMSWPYTYFFTITYSDEFVPKYDLSNFDVGEIVKEIRTLCRFRVSSSPDYFDRNVNYLKSFVERPYVCSVTDFQKFIKRLRYYISQLPGYEKERDFFRYYIVSEYGESSFRPHGHGLLFFKSELIRQNIQALLFKSWKFGISTIEPAREGCTNYVASYLNCSSDLPLLYSLKPFKPFRLFSRRPPLGSLSADDTYVRRLFNTEAVTENLYDRQSNSLLSAPLRPFLQNRLWPKIKGFADFSFDDRVFLYSSCTRYENFESFMDAVRSVSEVEKPSYEESILQRYFCSCDRFTLENCASRLFNISRRVFYQSSIFGLTIKEYVKKIGSYYDKVSQYNLRRQYEFQSDYVKNFSSLDLVAMYPLFLSDVVRGLASDQQILSLNETFGYNLDTDYDTKEIHVLDSIKVFKSYELDVYWREFNNAKTKHFKSYFRDKYNIDF